MLGLGTSPEEPWIKVSKAIQHCSFSSIRRSLSLENYLPSGFAVTFSYVPRNGTMLILLAQWFLTLVRSSPRVAVSQFQRFGELAPGACMKFMF